MGDEQATPSHSYSFRPFAEQDFYKAANKYLIDLSEIKPGQKIVELACGTGSASRMILEHLRGARDSLLIGVDVSAQALREAMEQLATFRDVTIQLVQTRAEQMSAVVKQRVDRVLLLNSIHNMGDKHALLEGVNQTLRSGGIFAFNSAFFLGAHPPETEQFYRRWMMRATRIAKAKYNVMPSAQLKVESRKQLTSDEYFDLLRQHNFTILKHDIKPTPITLQGWMDISHYEDFVQGALPGVPLSQASAALQEAVQQVMHELNIDAVPRNWLSVIAVRA